MERLGESSVEFDGKRSSKKKRSMKSCLIMLSAVHRNVQQIFSFAGSTGRANDTAGFGEHDYLVTLPEVDSNRQKNYFCGKHGAVK